jgi:hypothetical protein
VAYALGVAAKCAVVYSGVISHPNERHPMNTNTKTRKAIEEVQAGEVIILSERATFEVSEVTINVTEFGPFVVVKGYKFVQGGICGPNALERNGGQIVEIA